MSPNTTMNTWCCTCIAHIVVVENNIKMKKRKASNSSEEETWWWKHMWGALGGVSWLRTKVTKQNTHIDIKEIMWE